MGAGAYNRGWPAGLDICYIVRLLENMLRTLTPPAVVAARDQLLGFRNRERMPVAETKLAVVCAGHSKIV